MNRTITIGPAFGRDYTSKAKALADWDANLDFMIHDMRHSGYISKSSAPYLEWMGVTAIHLRYNNMRMVVVLKLK